MNLTMNIIEHSLGADKKSYLHFIHPVKYCLTLNFWQNTKVLYRVSRTGRGFIAMDYYLQNYFSYQFQRKSLLNDLARTDDRGGNQHAIDGAKYVHVIVQTLFDDFLSNTFINSNVA